MNVRSFLMGLPLALIVTSTWAQVTTNGGTTNTIPMFTGNSAIGNSSITQDTNGNVHIPGILSASGPGGGLYLRTAPDGQQNTFVDPKLLHEGLLSGDGSAATPWGLHIAAIPWVWGQDFIYYHGGAHVFLATAGNSPEIEVMRIQNDGTVHTKGAVNGEANFSLAGTGNDWSWEKIGTLAAPQGGENVQITASIHNGFNASNGQDATYFINFKTSNGQNVDTNGFAGNGSYYAIGANGTIPPGNIKWVANSPGTNATAYDLYIHLPSWTVGSHYTVSLSGNATWTNSATLVSSDPGPASNAVLIPTVGFNLPYGNFSLSGNGAAIQFPDGSLQSVAWNGTLCGGDYAESVNVSGERVHYEPGDVMVVSDSDSADVAKSAQPYSTLVAGIYSTKPGVLGRRQTGEKSDQEIPMAMVGIVPAKVNAENGPIKKGDLLVTSSSPGYAMKGSDPSRMLGAIVGKAMGNLDSGTGVIEVLVSLQ